MSATNARPTNRLLGPGRRIGRASLLGVPMVVLGAVTTVACSADIGEPIQESTATDEEALVDLNNPVAGANTTGSISALPNASGQLAAASSILEQPGKVHEGVYSNATNLNAVAGADSASWVNAATSDIYSRSSSFAGHLTQAASHAATKKSVLDEAALKTVFALFDGQIDVPPVAERYFTYTPERARWLEAQYGKAYYIQTNEGYYSYSDPQQLGDLRQQGARLYCAARKAQFVQNSEKLAMGALSPIKFSIFGFDIDLLSIEPTVSVDGPERFTSSGANNGSEAFSVPLVLGTRLFPLKGLIPHGLGEIQYPAVLVTGDSEVRNGSNYRWVQTTLPGYRYSKTYRSLTHADAIYSAYRPAVTADKRMELARVGPLAAELVLGMAVEIGNPYEQGTTAFNDRVISTGTDLFLGSPKPPTRSGRLWGDFWGPRTYHDGAIWHGSSGWRFLPEGNSDAWWRWDNGGSDDHLRVRQNNDHHIRPSLRVALTGGIGGTFGGSFGGMRFALSATGSLTGAVAQEHDLRDGMVVEVAKPTDFGSPTRFPMEATNVIVRPRTSARADIDFRVNIVIKASIKLPFKTISVTLVDKDLFHATKNIAEWDSDSGATWDTDTHMRIGYQQPIEPVPGFNLRTKSYLPLASGGYDTFPGGPSDINACLADTTPLPAPPTACEPESSAVQTPSSQVCLLVGGQGPKSICGDPKDAALTWTDLWSTVEQRDCLESYIRYLCTPTSKVQTWQQQQIVAHRLPMLQSEPGALHDAEQLNSVVTQCVLAHVGSDATEAQATTFAKTFFRSGNCTSTATMLDENSIVNVQDPNVSPPQVDKTPSGC